MYGSLYCSSGDEASSIVPSGGSHVGCVGCLMVVVEFIFHSCNSFCGDFEYI